MGRECSPPSSVTWSESAKRPPTAFGSLRYGRFEQRQPTTTSLDRGPVVKRYTPSLAESGNYGLLDEKDPSARLRSWVKRLRSSSSGPKTAFGRKCTNGPNVSQCGGSSLGQGDAPGCYFHTQILGDRDESPFPKAVPIPRFPSPFVTPMAAVEFALGELFQDKWQEEARQARDPQRRWRSIQQRRWSSLLMWQNDLVTRRASSPWVESFPSKESSSWIDLKHAKPPEDLFCLR